MNTDHLLVKEIYKSIQGESSFAGKPCTFIRLAGCPLRCRWCDTSYGFSGGKSYDIKGILSQTSKLGVNLVELTGGEPLAQPASLRLLEALVSNNYKVLIETGGSINLKGVPEDCHIIMDLKCPDSNMSEHNDWSNLELLKPTDEIKFVIASRNDFEWAVDVIEKNDLCGRFQVLMSPAWGLMKEAKLVEYILEADVPVRLNLQIHKYIWSPSAKGV